MIGFWMRRLCPQLGELIFQIRRHGFGGGWIGREAEVEGGEKFLLRLGVWSGFEEASAGAKAFACAFSGVPPSKALENNVACHGLLPGGV